ncbi:putative transglutaminase-like cysteine proteinase [Albidovulum inexpectatum]|uniref:Putative transglutaminase-like cysteine proteinase n=1 Tax=Albidovulum inexpectatum TaxID=196587 RepID=A0A2S5JIB4_9RHOB|nr:transglutaminase-like cysteine peptidase [Albidovulum inexpectatum]PPB81111.1 putative transglutaminase-like cysteine proteinase [Albidovulum inexpectatum]
MNFGQGAIADRPSWRVTLAIAIAVVACATGPIGSPAHGRGLKDVPAHLSTIKPIPAPPGFGGICTKYPWACAADRHKTGLTPEEVQLVKAVNREVNRRVPMVEDRVQYGTDELWTLPGSRGGDCEDLVLLKKQILISRGIPAGNLLIAAVLDRSGRSHAVLVARAGHADLVLDTLTDRVLPWHRTGYSFLKMQSPRAPSRWGAVLAGGIFNPRQ